MFHFASFNGKHNITKARVLIVLWNRHNNGLSGLTLKQLVRETGESYGSLKTLLSRWLRWRYIACKAVIGDNDRPVYQYKILAKGTRFVEIIPGPVQERVTAEIQARIDARRKTKRNYLAEYHARHPEIVAKLKEQGFM